MNDMNNNRSAKKTTEEELSLKSLVLDQIKDLVTITDLNGVITYVNDAVVKTMQLSRKKLTGSTIGIYGEDSGRGGTQNEILEKTKRDGSWRGEVVNYSADGTEHILDCRTQIIYDEMGNPVALCGISTNITERKKIEKALFESE